MTHAQTHVGFLLRFPHQVPTAAGSTVQVLVAVPVSTEEAKEAT